MVRLSRRWNRSFTSVILEFFSLSRDFILYSMSWRASSHSWTYNKHKTRIYWSNHSFNFLYCCTCIYAVNFRCLTHHNIILRFHLYVYYFYDSCTLLFCCIVFILSSLTTFSNSTMDLFLVSTLLDKLDFISSEDNCILRTSTSAVRHCHGNKRNILLYELTVWMWVQTMCRTT